MRKEELIAFEEGIAKLFEAGKIRVPIHLSGGNEEVLIDLFKEIKKDDYVFSSWRNHYHYLLHTGDWDGLLKQILGDREMGSMHTINSNRRFYSSAIVAGLVSTAVGVGVALQRDKKVGKVWVFCGDGCCDEGWFFEALRYTIGHDLPVTFVVEDNNRSVCTDVPTRWGKNDMFMDVVQEYAHVRYYRYKAKWPHVGTGKYVAF